MNEYSNIFGGPKIYEWISEYIRTGEMARIRIRIIFEGHFIRIFEYSNIRAHHWPKTSLLNDAFISYLSLNLSFCNLENIENYFTKHICMIFRHNYGGFEWFFDVKTYLYGHVVVLCWMLWSDCAGRSQVAT